MKVCIDTDAVVDGTWTSGSGPGPLTVTDCVTCVAYLLNRLVCQVILRRLHNLLKLKINVNSHKPRAEKSYIYWCPSEPSTMRVHEHNSRTVKEKCAHKSMNGGPGATTADRLNP